MPVRIYQIVGHWIFRRLTLSVSPGMCYCNLIGRSQKVLAIISNYLTAANRVSEQLSSLFLYISFLKMDSNWNEEASELSQDSRLAFFLRIV